MLIKPKHAIMKKAEVAESEQRSSFSHRPPRPGFLDRSCRFLIGLPGSGKTAVGRAMAERMGAEFRDLSEESLTLDEIEALADQGGGLVAAVPSEALKDPELREFLQRTGLVLFLMASVPALLPRLKDRLPGGTPDSAREILGRMLVEFEPLYHQTLHALVPADNPLDQVVEAALGKANP